MLAQTLSRLLIGAALVLACMAFTNMGRSADVSTPAVPLTSYHYSFDHQWYVWLPRHPTFEAVEIMSVDSPSNPYRLVWVIFTESEENKRQQHFIDDRWITEYVDNFHYREIEYRRAGAAGEGQSVYASFTNLDGARVEIEIDAEGVSLTETGAGLTDQSGHGAERVVMLFHRERTARTERNRVVIGGKDYSFRAGDDPQGTQRFIAAYNAGIQIVVFPFGQWSFKADETRLGDDVAGFTFDVGAREGGLALVADLPGYRDRITIELDSDGGLERYRHDAGSHRMVISLVDPLPLTGPAPQSASRFTILMDPDDPIAGGRVISEPTETGRRLSWTIDTPSWAAGYPFESLIEERDGGMALTIRSARPSD
ncbi:MAG: hypothetical protein OXN81_01155 [Alphaproteobacteria bacterium]|nr:hypothetical protein [Alphaproteobacteria bacterium]